MRVKYLPGEAMTWIVSAEDKQTKVDRIERDPGRIAAFFGRMGMTK